MPFTKVPVFYIAGNDLREILSVPIRSPQNETEETERVFLALPQTVPIGGVDQGVKMVSARLAEAGIDPVARAILVSLDAGEMIDYWAAAIEQATGHEPLLAGKRDS